MVAREGRKKRASKTLIREDGKQFSAQVGMVDKDGVMFNVQDVGCRRLEFHPMSWIVQDVEYDNERLRAELGVSTERAEKAVAALRRSVELCDELVGNGKFPYGSKQVYQERAWRLRMKLKGLMGDVEQQQ